MYSEYWICGLWKKKAVQIRHRRELTISDHSLEMANVQVSYHLSRRRILEMSLNPCAVIFSTTDFFVEHQLSKASIRTPAPALSLNPCRRTGSSGQRAHGGVKRCTVWNGASACRVRAVALCLGHHCGQAGNHVLAKAPFIRTEELILYPVLAGLSILARSQQKSQDVLAPCGAKLPWGENCPCDRREKDEKHGGEEGTGSRGRLVKLATHLVAIVVGSACVGHDIAGHQMVPVTMFMASSTKGLGCYSNFWLPTCLECPRPESGYRRVVLLNLESAVDEKDCRNSVLIRATIRGYSLALTIEFCKYRAGSCRCHAIDARYAGDNDLDGGMLCVRLRSTHQTQQLSSRSLWPPWSVLSNSRIEE
nr:hypothetical protein CFP56_36222 [Quercus suber]